MNRPAQAWVVHDELGDSASDDARRHAAAGGLDFREFGHRGGVRVGALGSGLLRRQI